MEEPRYHLTGVVHTRQNESEDFDGPLDVILLLLSKNKIEIQDVSITSILEQYLAWLEERKRMDLEIASEFIDMASHLMLIKTKMLLSAAEQEDALMEKFFAGEEISYDEIKKAIRKGCIARTITPDPHAAAKYDHLFTCYRRIHDALAPVYTQRKEQ